MTKNSTPQFEIEDYSTPEKANPYTDAVKALIDAGEGKALTIVVPAGEKRDGTPGEGTKDRVLFQAAAKAAGYRARTRDVVANDDGTVSVKFTVSPRNADGGESATIDGVATA